MCTTSFVQAPRRVCTPPCTHTRAIHSWSFGVRVGIGIAEVMGRGDGRGGVLREGRET